MTGFQVCKWVGAIPRDVNYTARYCNHMARPNDDLCATHRAQVDAELRKFETEYRRMAA